MTLAELPTAFVGARAQAAANARYSKSSAPPDTCHYCGRGMVRWPSRRTDGHARCFVPVSFQRELHDLYLADARATQQRIAELCDVSMNTVRIWINNADARIGRAV